MNASQLRRLRLKPGDLLLVRGTVKMEELIRLRQHFGDKITVAQIPHRNFLESVPFDILERIYLGAKKSFEEKQFAEMGDVVRVSFPVAEARVLQTIAFAYESAVIDPTLSAFAESAAKRLQNALIPFDVAELNRAAETKF